MVQLTDLVAVAVLGYVGVQLVRATRMSLRRGAPTWRLLRGLRPRHFLLALPTVAGVLVVGITLMSLPVLSWGWWTALGGVGNPVFGATDTTSGSPLAVIIPAVFMVLLVLGLPILVLSEEWIFRRGAQWRSLTGNVAWSLLFGMAHALIGIPIGAALALSVGGGYLTWRYLRGWKVTGSQEGALRESARSHLAYNLVILVAVALAFAFG